MAWNPNPEQPNDPPPTNPYGSPQSPYRTPPRQESSYDPNQPYTEFGPQVGPPYAGGPQYQTGQPYPGPQNQAGQPYPGRAQYQMGYYPPQAQPRPLGEALRELPHQYWRVLTKPSARTFAEEMGKASWDIVLVQLAIYAVIAALISFLGSYLGLLLFSSYLGSSNSITNTGIYGALNAIFSFGTIIIVPISFFIGSGILFGLAKAFNGEGKFVTQNYALLLFEVPLGILGGLLGLIPFVNILTGLGVAVYRIILAIFAIMAVHRLNGGKATAVVLIPIGVAVFLYIV